MKFITFLLILYLLLFLTGCAETIQETAPTQTPSEPGPDTGLEEDLNQLDEDLELDEIDNIEEDINTFDW